MEEEKIENTQEKNVPNSALVEESPWAIGKHAADSTGKNKTKKKLSKKAKIIIGVVVGALCVLSVAAAALWSFLNMSFEDDDFKIRDELAQTSFDEPFYMLLIGTDTREGNTYKLEDGRSDSCILVRIDPNDFVVTMLSIPRDTKINYNGYTEKFNAVYAAGGVAETIKQVKKMFNVDISHYAEISFNGLTDMVDAVGGVDVYVPQEIDDPNTDVFVPQGQQTLNGEQALSFSRSRNFADGDFTRTADQRVLIEALIKKAYNMNLTDLPNVLRVVKNYVKTDLRLGDMLGLATQFIEAEQLTINSSMFAASTSSEDGVSYVILDWSAARRQIKMAENNEPPKYVEINSGAAVCSSRDAENLKAEQEAFYKEHPDSPGLIKNDKSKNSDYDDYDSYYNEYSNNGYDYYSEHNEKYYNSY